MDFKPPDYVNFFRIISVSATLNNPLRTYIHRIRSMLGAILPSTLPPRIIRPYNLITSSLAARNQLTGNELRNFEIESFESENITKNLTQYQGEISTSEDPFTIPSNIIHRYVICDDDLKVRQLSFIARWYLDAAKKSDNRSKRSGILVIVPNDVFLKILLFNMC